MAEIVLTDEQKVVLAHDRRLPARVLAGPGTGKSVTLVALIGETPLEWKRVLGRAKRSLVREGFLEANPSIWRITESGRQAVQADESL